MSPVHTGRGHYGGEQRAPVQPVDAGILNLL